MPTYSTTNLGPYFTQSGVQQPQGGGAGKDAFVVNVNDLGPALSNPSVTHLEMSGGYAVSDPTNISGGSGYGGEGLNFVNAPNPTILDQIKFWVSQNPILAVGLGIGGLLLLRGGGGGRRR